MATLAEQLLRAIEKSGKSRYRIAQESGLEQAALSRFVHRERDLSLESVEKLCKALGVRIVLEPQSEKQPRRKRK